MKTMYHYLTIILIFLSLTITSLFSQNNEMIIDKIFIESNKEAKKKIINTISFKEGDFIDNKKINIILKEIYSLGIFDDVKINLQNINNENTLIIKVKELLKINTIKFQGNKKFSSAYLRDEIYTKERQFFKPYLINESIEKMKGYYSIEGYLNPSIVTNTTTNEKDNTVDITYIIQEGFQILVGKINFKNNQALTSKEIKRRMQTKETKWYKSSSFDMDNIETDKQLIPYIYKIYGYLNSKILDINYFYSWKNPKKKKKQMVNIDISVSEGEPSYFGEIKIIGNKLYTKNELYNLLKRKAGAIFNQETHDKDIQSIRDNYQKNGFIFSSITDIPTYYVNEDGKNIVDYTLEIYEGKQAHIEKIFIRGNNKTKDFVIRRELLFREGEVFNRFRVQRSMERLFNTQYFKDIKPEPRPGSVEGLMNLIINIEEKRTAFISGGGGYSFDSGIFLRAKIEDINFLGRGYQFGGSIEAGFNKQYLNIYFTDPYLANIPLSLQTNIMLQFIDRPFATGKKTKKSIDPDTRESLDSNSNNNYYKIPLIGRHGKSTSSILFKSFSFSIGADLNYQFFDYFNVGTGLYYTLEKQYWDDVIKVTTTFKRVETQKETWEKNKSLFDQTLNNSAINIITIPFRFNINSLDNYIFPTKGWKFESSISLLTVDYQVSKYFLGASYYQKLGIERVVLGFHGQIKSLGSLFGKEIIYSPSYYYTFNFTQLRGWNQSDIITSRRLILNTTKNYKEEDLLVLGNPWGQSTAKFGLDLNISIVRNIISFVFYTQMGNIYAKPLSSRKAYSFLLNPKYFMYSFGPGLALDIPSFPMQFFLSWRTVYDPITKRFKFLEHKGNSKIGYAPEFVFSVKGLF